MQPKVGIAYTFALPGEGDRHKFGVNSLALARNASPQSSWAGGVSLFTAGRDARVRRWDVSALESSGGFSARRPARKLPLVATYADHSDWVTDVVVASSHGLLVSASSDHTLKLWPLDEPGTPEPRATVSTHTDYVKALAYAPASGVLASASLDKMIHLFKMDALGHFAASGGASGGGVEFSTDGQVRDGPTVLAGHRDSVYCLAMNSAGTLVASGSVEPEIRLWDARVGRKHAKLSGHTDVVRALLLDADGKLAVSASSDRTVRVWDVGSQRCVHTVRMHRDAAWALDVDAHWRVLYSGGRDGSIVATSLSTLQSVRVAHEAAPVVRLAASAGGNHLWAATTQCDVRCWSLDGVGAALQQGGAHAAAVGADEGGGGGGADEPAARPPPTLERDAVGLIEGAPAIHSSRVLADKWRVLTCDTAGRVVVWDVLRGSVVRTFADGTSMAAAEKELALERAVPSWFSVDTRSGDLTVCLDEKSAFAGLLYADDVGLSGPDVADDATINLGWNALMNVFGPWVQQRQQPHGSGRANGRGAAKPRAPLPLVKLEAAPQSVSVAITEGGRVVLRTSVEGTRALAEHRVPNWVSDALLAHRFYSREKQKVPFYVVPDAAKSLSGLVDGSTRLEALRILRMRQVIRYVAQNLVTPISPEGAKPASEVRWEEHIEILCNERVLPASMDLFSARTLVWRNSAEDMVLVYRRVARAAAT